jgi:hypothetical protein
MHRFGEPSWGLRMSGGDVDALLYVRDALRMSAASDADPPTWSTPVAAAWPASDPDEQPHLPRGRGRVLVATAATARAWSTWWRELVARQLVRDGVDLRGCPLAPAWAREPPPVVSSEPTSLADSTPEAPHRRIEPLSKRAQDLAAHDHDAVPGLAVVSDPVLRRAAHALWPAARQWAQDREAAWSGDPRSWDEQPPAAVPADAVPHEVYERTAHDVAFDAGVPLQRVRAHLVLIECPGRWFQVWAPGVLLCSREVMADPATAGPLLYTAFRSATDA